MNDKAKTEHRLFDGQWMNIVNHDNCYSGYTVEDAVNLAVKKTEEAMAKNIHKENWPVKQA